jgi:hypothetical protein
MKLKVIIFILFISSIHFISCNEEIVSPSEDDILTSRLIGKWEATNYDIITFNGNGSFIDTALGLYNTNYETHYVLKGDYLVKNGIIYFTNVSLTYFKGWESPSIISFSTMIDPKKVSFANDILNMEPVKILEPSNNLDYSLNGEWQSIVWLGCYEKSSQPNFKGGQIKETYNFSSDSLICHYQTEFLFQTNMQHENRNINYNYNGSSLNLGYPPYYRVEFKDNRMYWFYYSVNYSKK